MDLCAGVSFSDPSAETGTRTTEVEGLLFASFNRASPARNGAPGETSEPSKYLFGVFIGAEFSLSNLPLVGKEISLVQAIGVKDLQLFAASQALQAADTEQMIGLLGPTKLTLPKQEAEAGQPDDAQKSQPANILERGITLTAVLMLGAEQKDLVLSSARGAQERKLPAASEAVLLAGVSGTDLAPVPAAAPSAKWIKIQKSFGPFRFERIGFQYQDQVIWFLLDASLSAAGLALSLDGLGFGSSITRFEPQFDLHGLGVQFKKGEVEISGAFLKTAVNEYSGKAVLKTTKFALSAIGSYATLNGQPSMFIYAVLNFPLGGPPFFFVTGLAAGFGYNRSLLMPSIDQVKQFPLVQEACADQKPEVVDAGEALVKLQEYVPAQTGQYFLAAGVRFTSFKMIDSFALLAVSFGQHFEIDILGISTIKIPFSAQGEGKPCLAEIQVAFKASFIPDEGFLGVIAQLSPSSYILDKKCHLSGGLAFYYWFSGEHSGDFVLTVGGYHSSFAPPPHYPKVEQVPRLSIGWKVDNCLGIKGSAYFALTPTLLMAGGSLEATWQSGPLKAWFTAGADFLIAWKPFHYDAYIYVDMGVSYTFWFFGTHHITAHLGADLHVWGPEFSGTAHIHLWFISFTISFGPSRSQAPKPIPWQEFEASFLPANILSVSVKNGLVSQSDTDQAAHLGIINPKDFSLAVDSLVPVKASPNYSETGNGFGIAPMDLSEIETELTMTIDGVEKPEGFEYIPIKKNVPAGLWGTEFQPGLQSEALVMGVISGCEITAKDPTSSAEPVEYSTLQHDPDRKALDFQWEKGISVSTEPKTDGARRQAMKDCLTKTNGVRQGILADLGIESEGITMNENIAEVFLFAPQIDASAG
jgi:hypothetical protein